MKNQIFKNNTANSGGAIIYKNQRPQMENVTFLNNSAYYGPNIASYPIYMRIVEKTENGEIKIIQPEFSLKPSIDIPIFYSLILGVFDIDGQMVNLTISSE